MNKNLRNNISLLKDDYKLFFGKKVAFIFPARIVGGHELMTIEIIKDLESLGVIIDVYSEPSNHLLTNYFEKMNNLNLYRLPFLQPKLEVVHAFLNIRLKSKVKQFLKELDKKKYTSIILVQGDIEIGSLYTTYCGKIKTPLISYIPFTHSGYLMSKKMWFIRDILSKRIYLNVRKYITIFNAAATDLVKFSKGAEVVLIRNKTRDLSAFKDKRLAFSKLDTKFKIYIIGRIDFKQKGHDILLESLSKIKISKLNLIELNVIGNGHDLDKFKKIHQAICPSLEVKFHGWHKEPWDIAYDADLLVVPSRFEGVPLVIIEAIELGVPVLAKISGGVPDYVEINNLFNTTHELTELIEREMDNNCS